MAVIKRQGSEGKGKLTRREFLRRAGAAGAMALTSPFWFSYIRALGEVPIKIGHITPRTGFLGMLGDFAVKGATLAVEEANARGGVLGRRVDIVFEDSPNPGVAVEKATKLIERDRVDVLIGEISSASGLAVADVAKRLRKLYMNTGWNSDEGRGVRCNRYVFHVEGMNTMYTKAVGRYLFRKREMRAWYFLTADYAFGHDLLRVSRRLLRQLGGREVGSDLVPTGTPDYSSYILKVRAARPDLLFLNLAGVDQTTFMKQWREFGAPFPVAGGVMDTAQFWAVGREALTGVWPALWYHKIKAPGVADFVSRFRRRWGSPPDNQAWADYTGSKLVLRAMEETKSTDSAKLIEFFEKGPRFDILKELRAWFANWNHQLVQPMYVVVPKEPAKAEDKWDIWEVIASVPGLEESLVEILPTPSENPCELGSL